jgi:hypothetical protein
MEKLLRYLKSLQVGPVTGNIEYHLSSCWEHFERDDEGMSSNKLLGRMEDIYWNPPILTFVIERHGGTALGSTRAELQQWELNMNKRTATCQEIGYRQIYPKQAKIDVSPIAKEIAQLIITHQKDERLKWNKNGDVSIQIGRILPEGSAVTRTLAGRRKRLRKQIDELLINEGWKKVRENVYAPSFVGKGEW